LQVQVNDHIAEDYTEIVKDTHHHPEAGFRGNTAIGDESIMSIIG